ncbi:MAG: hypothetical protein KDJ62_03815 [Rhodobiaceae bacterium]|nr:hypothetical protein [Rhodobiaceae bacterium]MCC0049860.1 hypothetical protein [Rhodobiaceae bacterium]
MRADTAHEIIATQPDARRAFDYAADSYAPRLLGHVLNREIAIAELRDSRFGRLLARPNMAALAGFSGSGRIGPGMLGLADGHGIESRELAQNYIVNLDIWDGDDRSWRMWQVSRRGVNLVVRLDFTARHDAAYRDFLRPGKTRPFAYFAHPGNRDGYNTLAWARIDLDLDTGEALIEEVQTDWLRLAALFHKRVKAGARAVLNGQKIPAERVHAYMELILAPHKALWQEAMMMAALRVIVEDIGIRSIFMHTPESGARLKNIGEKRVPPRSIYSDLPRKFCFSRGSTLPRFLEGGATRRIAALRRKAALPMWHLDLTPGAL